AKVSAVARPIPAAAPVMKTAVLGIRHDCPWPSLHRGQVVPEVAKAVGTAEQRGEVRGIDQYEVARSLTGRRHPDQCVELRVARFRERMWPVRVDPLTAEDLQFLAFRCGEFVVRQVRMEV